VLALHFINRRLQFHYTVLQNGALVDTWILLCNRAVLGRPTAPRNQNGAPRYTGPVTIALWIGALLLMGLGFLGTVVPGLPGVLLLYAGFWLAAWIDHFARVGWPTLLILGLITALALVADLVAGLLGAKRLGASRQALIGSVLGGLIGPFVGLGWVGLLVGPFVGAVAGELMARRPLGTAARVGFGTWLGLIVGTLVKLALSVSMLAIFAVAYLV